VPAGITVGSGTPNMMSHCEDLAFIYGESATHYPTKEIMDNYDGDVYTRETKAFGDRIGTVLQVLCKGRAYESQPSPI
jgi:hypothetical protein